MPLFKTIKISENTYVFVWKITETFDEIRDVHLSKNSLNRLSLMKSIPHQKGFLSIRHLLKHINLNDDNLFYNEFGKPFLKNGQHISITHSYDFSAIVISNTIVGIDIEKNREKIKIIKHRFTDFEQQNLSNDEFIKQLTFIWGAKEAMFKIHPSGGMSFKNDLVVQKFKSNKTKGFINTPELKQDCIVYFHQLEDYSLAIAVINNTLTA